MLESKQISRMLQLHVVFVTVKSVVEFLVWSKLTLVALRHKDEPFARRLSALDRHQQRKASSPTDPGVAGREDEVARRSTADLHVHIDTKTASQINADFTTFRTPLSRTFRAISLCQNSPPAVFSGHRIRWVMFSSIRLSAVF